MRDACATAAGASPLSEMMNDIANKELSAGMIGLFAVSCGITVANLYYSQPLLTLIAKSFQTTESAAGYMFALTLVGYTTGLMFLVPMGDIVNKRKMVLILLSIIFALHFAVIVSPNIFALGLCLYLLGCCSIVAQLIIPLAAGLTVPEKRGSVVGFVMSGLLVGILASRSVSGFLASLYGWRAIYWVAAALTLMLLLALALWMPNVKPKMSLPYIKLIKSLAIVFREHAILRSSCAFGAATFAGFGIFWTNFTFYAAGAPYHYNSEVIGLFGLLGLAGCAGAAFAGKFADKSGPLPAITVAFILILVAFAVLGLFGSNLIALCLGVILLDLGAQVNQVSNQSRIYTLPHEIHSRVNTLYMTAYFLGGSAGSAIGTYAWMQFGWMGVCTTGFIITLLGLLLVLLARKQREDAKA